MNVIGWIVLVALVADYAIELVATVLNLRSLDPELPRSFADQYDDQEYLRSQLYTRDKSSLGLVSGGFGLAVVLAFWFLGGFEIWDQMVRSAGYGETATGVIYILSLALAQSALGIPFDAYRTFHLEKKFGFNRTTLPTFVFDRFKGLVLTIVLGAPLIGMVLAFFTFFGTLAWLYCWVALTVVSVVLQYAAPTLIMPLFNRFDPLEAGPLRAAILSYADQVKFPLTNIFVIDGSRRSSKGNAFFTGFGKTKRVALYDTLIERHSTEEIVAIVAHEIGHYKKHHIIQGTVVGILHTGVVLFFLSLMLSSQQLFEAFLVTEPSLHTGLIFFGLLFKPVEMILSVAMNALSRSNEFEADAFAVDTTSNGSAMSSALKRLTTENLANLTPHPVFVKLYYSHPPVVRRIEAIDKRRT
jgi:STE24 endopeptidase